MVTTIRTDLIKGRGTVGEAVDLLLCEIRNEKEILRRVTVHLDEERM